MERAVERLGWRVDFPELAPVFDARLFDISEHNAPNYIYIG